MKKIWITPTNAYINDKIVISRKKPKNFQRSYQQFSTPFVEKNESLKFMRCNLDKLL